MNFLSAAISDTRLLTLSLLFFITGLDLRMQPKWLKNLATSDIPSKNSEPTDLTRKIPKSEKANSLGITNESLSDANGHESIANVIGHT